MNTEKHEYHTLVKCSFHFLKRNLNTRCIQQLCKVLLHGIADGFSEYFVEWCVGSQRIVLMTWKRTRRERMVIFWKHVSSYTFSLCSPKLNASSPAISIWYYVCCDNCGYYGKKCHEIKYCLFCLHGLIDYFVLMEYTLIKGHCHYCTSANQSMTALTIFLGPSP